MNIAEFNLLSLSQARALLRPCVDIASWAEEVAQARPFSSLDAALQRAESASQSWQQRDVEQALAQHPRIGQQAVGEGKHAELSRHEQSTLELDGDAIKQALVTGNQQYEQRFARVFLIRARGRTSAEILENLERRLHNTPAQEWRETTEQLQQITLLRFKELFD
ncbi:2-oxo-4-hydroxy-4-carboxy-5-ureidoimidazoline decarboxylase [Rouxiella sp. Mn2063]|uniref:2-oxo-4-hydroxy-4-carboxy-5-ureidoimidazoline decarboxylase n=1 Tax=Rouxiella sp. Mn2063 TaxID=3395262 RepID=UPI003BE38D59